MIRFIDQGQGIPEEQIHKLGEPFYTTKEKDTGLGLMMCLKIIEANHDTMQIDSVLGQGTTIELSFPVYGVPPEHTSNETNKTANFS